MGVTEDPLDRLEATIRARRNAAPDTSYTAQLFAQGRARIARKLGEEAIETVVAALGPDPAAIVPEAADLLYHLLVLLADAGLSARRRPRRTGAARGHWRARRKGRPRAGRPVIIAATPGARRIVAEIWRPLALLFLWDVAVTAGYYYSPFRAPELPLTLFGSALALFLGFRSNSAYQRWWEGRVLWGAMINASRALARTARNFLPEPDAHDLKRTIVLRQIAYVNTLRCQLRRQPHDGEVLRFLSKREAEPALARANAANGLVDGTGRRIADAARRGWIDTVQQAEMERLLVDITNAQGGMERLKNTPLPYQYRFFPTLFTHLVLPVAAGRAGRDAGASPRRWARPSLG